MKIGLLAYSTDTGLGIQTQSFARHMNPSKVLVADLSRFNGMETHHERFPDARIVNGIPSCEDMDWLTDDVDVVFVCETPLNYCLFEKAKAKGVKTVLQYNYEFLDYLNQPTLEPPSVLAAPTPWGQNDVENRNIAPIVDLPVPVDAYNIGKREITECRTIFHVAGKQAVHDRNGTMTFVEAAIKCGNRFKYKIYAQTLDGTTETLIKKAAEKIDLEVIYNVENNADMYKDGDVMVMPRKYGGLCLPMQEALAAGIPVIMPDIAPNNQRLPKEWLVLAKPRGSFMTRTEIAIYDTDANWLAFKMLEFFDEQFMSWSNKEATEIGELLAWKRLKSYYDEILSQVVSM